MSKPKALKIPKLPAFLRALSPEARKLVDEARPYDGDALHFVGFQNSALWPIKPWYQRCFGKFFNKLVADGVVEQVMAVGSIEIASGGRVVQDLEYRDLGPDKYGIIFVFFYSKFTPEELREKRYLHDGFGIEGEVRAHFPSWFHMVDPIPMIKDGELVRL